MDMVGRIRRLHSRGKKSAREIARITGLSRNTVAKWLQGPAEAPPNSDCWRRPKTEPLLRVVPTQN